MEKDTILRKATTLGIRTLIKEKQQELHHLNNPDLANPVMRNYRFSDNDSLLWRLIVLIKITNLILDIKDLINKLDKIRFDYACNDFFRTEEWGQPDSRRYITKEKATYEIKKIVDEIKTLDMQRSNMQKALDFHNKPNNDLATLTAKSDKLWATYKVNLEDEIESLWELYEELVFGENLIIDYLDEQSHEIVVDSQQHVES